MILEAAVASAAVSVLLGTGWLMRRKKPEMPPAKTKLSVQLDVAEHKRLRIWADKQGMTLSEYVRRTLVASVPKKEAQRQEQDERSLDVINRAFEELDQTESFPTGVFAMPPARKPQVGVPTEAERTHPRQRVTRLSLTQVSTGVPPGPHPCVHLALTEGPAHLQGQCHGSCNQTSQRGRPCFWTPTTARNCPVFEPKMTGEELRLAR
jgi:hypothetical protein